MTRLETGIDNLDRALDGGVESGSIIAVFADPSEQCEPILEEMARKRRTLYITTARRAEDVKRTMRQQDMAVGDSIGVQYVDPTESVIDDTLNLAKKPPKGTNIIIDTIDPIEKAGEERCIKFFQDLKEKVVAIDGLAIVFGMMPEASGNRRVTEKMADVVLELECNWTKDDKEVFLQMKKQRAGGSLDPMKLEIGEEVKVDTSRDIG